MSAERPVAVSRLELLGVRVCERLDESIQLLLLFRAHTAAAAAETSPFAMLPMPGSDGVASRKRPMGMPPL
ncbi:unnamed protein product [Gongylonema pulchrum]|uniref:Uncharacterized protein n=1 Tax=Gongylonema pulchrum TaxID=637853 RepID=A0A183E7S7_9BILA|nr:unnamed protein product [Gongylonema pulchrum]